MSNKIVIIPDLHNRVDWVEACLKEIPHDRVVFLGDYFDSFGDGPSIAKHTAEWLRASLEDPKRIHLFGNHDMPYFFPQNRYLYCPGFDLEKQRAILSVLPLFETREKLKLCHFENNYLFSHAGAHPELFTHPTEGMSVDWVQEQAQAALQREIVSGFPSPVVQYSSARMGLQNHHYFIGGLTWCDWNQEFRPAENINQIVGHTVVTVTKFNKYGETYVESAKEPGNKCIRQKNSHNWNLDCARKIIGILEDETFSFVENHWLYDDKWLERKDFPYAGTD
jgi:hypothetical protein